jgi:hypothetical protein
MAHVPRKPFQNLATNRENITLRHVTETKITKHSLTTSEVVFDNVITNTLPSFHRFHSRPPSWFPSTANAHQHRAWWVNALQVVHFAPQARG